MISRIGPQPTRLLAEAGNAVWRLGGFRWRLLVLTGIFPKQYLILNFSGPVTAFAVPRGVSSEDIDILFNLGNFSLVISLQAVPVQDDFLAIEAFQFYQVFEFFGLQDLVDIIIPSRLEDVGLVFSFPDALPFLFPAPLDHFPPFSRKYVGG
jgi:hypothetical protein